MHSNDSQSCHLKTKKFSSFQAVAKGVARFGGLHYFLVTSLSRTKLPAAYPHLARPMVIAGHRPGAQGGVESRGIVPATVAHQDNDRRNTLQSHLRAT